MTENTPPYLMHMVHETSPPKIQLSALTLQSQGEQLHACARDQSYSEHSELRSPLLVAFVLEITRFIPHQSVKTSMGILIKTNIIKSVEQ